MSDAATGTRTGDRNGICQTVSHFTNMPMLLKTTMSILNSDAKHRRCSEA